MKVLVLSDVHIAQTTPWSRDYEDIKLVLQYLKHRKEIGEIPKFDACILCGDIFNTPRLNQGDPAIFTELLDVLEVTDKPVGAINGNHDPGGHHVCEYLKGFHRLDYEPMMGIEGHSYSQNIEEIREWLKRSKAQITVTHQSCSLFMNLGNLQLPQLRGEDFHAPLNFIGDTHVSHAVEVKGSSMCVSPGILCPMRSRSELFDANPHLTYFEADYLGDGKWDLENADLKFLVIPKRPAMLVTSETTEQNIRTFDFDCKHPGLPGIVYVPKSLETGIDFSKFAHLRVIRFPDLEKDLEVDIDYSDVLEGAKTIDTILATADKLLADDSDKPTILALVKDMLENEQPTEVVKQFLGGGNDEAHGA